MTANGKGGQRLYRLFIIAVNIQGQPHLTVTHYFPRFHVCLHVTLFVNRCRIAFKVYFK